MSDVPVSLGYLVSAGREGFGLEGEELTEFMHCSVRALLDAGGLPVERLGGGFWKLQSRYGNSKEAIIKSVIAEWLAQDEPMPKPWTSVFFGLPASEKTEGWE